MSYLAKKKKESAACQSRNSIPGAEQSGRSTQYATNRNTSPIREFLFAILRKTNGRPAPATGVEESLLSYKVERLNFFAAARLEAMSVSYYCRKYKKWLQLFHAVL